MVARDVGSGPDRIDDLQAADRYGTDDLLLRRCRHASYEASKRGADHEPDNGPSRPGVGPATIAHAHVNLLAPDRTLQVCTQQPSGVKGRVALTALAR